MSSVIQSSRFFGLDTRLLGREVRAAWQQIQEWPVVAWLSPEVRVRLARADGQTSLWLVDGVYAHSLAGDSSVTRFGAVELPEDDFLLRRIELPPLPLGEVAQAVALEVAGASPFAADDVVWGYAPRRAASGKLEIDIALASRQRVVSHLQGLPGGAWQPEVTEVWAMTGSSSPVIFGGFGEARRIAYAKVRRRGATALLAVALGLMTAAAVTPVAQSRLRAIDAQQAADELTKRVEPLLRQRSVLLRNAKTAQELQELLAEGVDPLFVMDLLTRVLPDDTSLLGLNIQGSKISITGSTPNAAALMQQLSARPELRDVKAPTAATRPMGTTKDSFNIEFTLAAAPPRAAAAASGTIQGTATSPTFPSPSSAPVTTASPLLRSPPPSPPQPATQSGASFGGAAFGAPPQPAKAP